VHKRLAVSRVAVFYDPSAARPSKTAYRYAAHPVFLGEQRLFHPKCIFIAGTDVEGTLWLYTLVMSANLSLSGWGRNCEGAFDTWVHAKREQPAGAAIGFFRDLDARLKNRPFKDRLLPDLVTRLDSLHDRRTKADPDGSPWEAKAHRRLYFSPQHPSLWSFVRKAYHPEIQEVRVASPYWGEGTRIKALLPAVRLELVASRRTPHFDVTLLGANTLEQLGVPTSDVSTWSNDQEDKGRFFHMKLYRIVAGGRPVTGTGSCNFTTRGLMWEGPDGETGNVECMLFDRLDVPWPRTERARPAAIPAKTDNSDAPQAWLVYVHVQYDWERHGYSWGVEGRPRGDPVELQLPDGEAFFELENDQGSRPGELKSREFKFRWKGETYVGIVAEVNLAHSDRQYGTVLSASQILDSWRSGAPSEPLLPDDVDDEAPATDSVGADALAKANGRDDRGKPFDWFLFFRCAAQRRERIAEAADCRELLELLVSRTDSAARMAAAAMVDAMPAAGRWIVVHECAKLLKPHRGHPEVRAHLRKMVDDLGTLRNAVLHSLAELAKERPLAADPSALLAWYDLQLRKQ
jgi:hypothetical protein